MCPVPTSSYLICASQRSGTTMLARALADTGVAGGPEEYFLAEDPARLSDWRFWEEGPFGRRHGARDREHYLEIVFGLGTTDNGVFGAKLLWNNLHWAVEKFRDLPRFAGLDQAEVIRRAFPSLHVVHVLRRDRVRQAVSWARMIQDGVWVVSDHEPGRPCGNPRYDFDLILALERQIAEGEQGWRKLFGQLGLAPLVLYYEDIATDPGYDRAVRTVLDHLGVQPPVGFQVPPRRTHRQADGLTEDWVRRFREDATGW